MMQQGMMAPAGGSMTGQYGAPTQAASPFSDPQQLRQFLGMAVLSGQMDPSSANFAFEMLSPQSQQPSLNDLQTITKAQTGLQELQNIEDLYGGGTSLMARLPLPNFLQTGKAQQFDTASSNFADILGRLRSGAQVTAEEEARFKKLLPQFGDTEETRQAKMMALRQELGGYVNNPATSPMSAATMPTRPTGGPMSPGAVPQMGPQASMMGSYNPY